MVKRWKQNAGNDSSLSKTDQCNLHYRCESSSDVIYTPTGSLVEFNITLKIEREREKKQNYFIIFLSGEIPIPLSAHLEYEKYGNIYSGGICKKLRMGLVPGWKDSNKRWPERQF